jgi:hypothetical protein
MIYELVMEAGPERRIWTWTHTETAHDRTYERCLASPKISHSLEANRDEIWFTSHPVSCSLAIVDNHYVYVRLVARVAWRGLENVWQRARRKAQPRASVCFKYEYLEKSTMLAVDPSPWLNVRPVIPPTLQYRVALLFNWCCIHSGLENREYGWRDPLCWPPNTLYPLKLALTSPTTGGLRPRIFF